MTIERCDKCGKPFMSQSEVERHKLFEHPVPVPAFEERYASDSSGSSSGNNGGINAQNVHKMTRVMIIFKRIGGGQIRKFHFK